LFGHAGKREIVGLTATIDSYNPVSRFLQARAVDPEQVLFSNTWTRPAHAG